MANAPASFWNGSLDSQSNLRLLRATIWFITIGAGFLQAWSARFTLSPDASNYLDIASAYLRGDWKNAVNAYWSPFFSWLLALCLGVLRPNPFWESTVLHLLNFVGLLAALLTFEFFFRAFLRLRRQSLLAGEIADDLPEWAWWALGYALFLSTSLLVLTVAVTTPDVWVAVWTYLVAGLLLRIRMVGGSPYLFAALGFALACAYFTKTFYFPMSFVFLITAWLCAGNPRKTAKHAIFGFAVFLLVAGPWVAALSRAKGRLTFGDTGKMNFAMMIDNIPRPAEWQGEDQTGTPKHPVRQLLDKPRLYEFATPIGGSYPPGYDWSYWMDGVRPHFSFPGFHRVLRQSAGTFIQIWLLQVECSVALLAFLLMWDCQSGWTRILFREWHLWVPPLIACLAYAIVHVEPRLVAPFVLLCWIAGFSTMLGVTVEVSRRVAIALVLAVVAVIGLRVTKSSASNLVAALTWQEHVNWQIAQGLRQMGLRPGDKVSGLALGYQVNWARLAGVTIVSEMPLGEETAFHALTPEEQLKVLQLMAGTGAKVLVTAQPPLCAVDRDWIPLGNTGFYARRLPPKPA